MTSDPGVKNVTTEPSTAHGTDQPPLAGTVTTRAAGTVGAPGTDGSMPTRNRDHAETGTGTGTMTSSSTGTVDTVPQFPGRHRWLPRSFRRDRNQGTMTTGTDGHGSGSSSPEIPKADSGALVWAVIWALTAVTTWMAGSGQLRGWTWAGLDPTDLHRFGLPFQAELAVVGWLLMGRWAVSKKRSPYPWWMMAFVFACYAVGMNCVDGGWRPGLIFGGASAVSLAFWFAKFYIDYIGHQVDAGLRDDIRPKVLSLGSMLQPRIDIRAALLSRRYTEITTVGQARRLAELFSDIRIDTRVHLRAKAVDGKRPGPLDARRTARRTAYDAVKRQLGIPVIVRQGVQIATVTFAAPEPAPLTVPQTWPGIAPVSGPPAAPATAPKPTLSGPATKPTAPVPAAQTDQAQAESVPQEWFEQHAERITRVQSHFPDWATRENRLTVDQVQKEVGIGNRKHAGEVAKCLRVLRQDLTPAATTTAPHDEGGD